MDTGVQRNKSLVSALIRIPMEKAGILRHLTVSVQLCAWHLCLVENTETVYRDICGCLSHIHQLLFLFEDSCDEEADGTPSSTGGTCQSAHPILPWPQELVMHGHVPEPLQSEYILRICWESWIIDFFFPPIHK